MGIAPTGESDNTTRSTSGSVSALGAAHTGGAIPPPPTPLELGKHWPRCLACGKKTYLKCTNCTAPICHKCLCECDWAAAPNSESEILRMQGSSITSARLPLKRVDKNSWIIPVF